MATEFRKILNIHNDGQNSGDVKAEQIRMDSNTQKLNSSGQRPELIERREAAYLRAVETLPKAVFNLVPTP
jgi:hypothetical protein